MVYTTREKEREEKTDCTVQAMDDDYVNVMWRTANLYERKKNEIIRMQIRIYSAARCN